MPDSPSRRGLALPPPGADALEHSRRLAAVIAAEISAAGGSIGFDRYMELALYAPRLGYYAAGAGKLGASGDFVTAPELTPLFGRTLARFVAAAVEGEQSFEILELGGGSGALAAALLGELARLGRRPACYRLLETSPDLRERQHRRLAGVSVETGVAVRFDERLPEEPLRGVVIANEVADAIPVRRFRMTTGAIEEARVALEGDRFGWRFEHSADERLTAEVARATSRAEAELPHAYVSEVAPARRAWLGSLARAVGRGVVLLLDYGYTAGEYYHPQRSGGTLACHYRHRRHEDPFLWPGLNDITAHVDFSTLGAEAVASGLELAGFTTQAHFLLGNGLLELCAELDPGSQDYSQAAGMVQRLTMPQEMGETIRVMALTRAMGGRPLPGFSVADLRGRL